MQSPPGEVQDRSGQEGKPLVPPEVASGSLAARQGIPLAIAWELPSPTGAEQRDGAWGSEGSPRSEGRGAAGAAPPGRARARSGPGPSAAAASRGHGAA